MLKKTEIRIEEYNVYWYTTTTIGKKWYTLGIGTTKKWLNKLRMRDTYEKRDGKWVKTHSEIIMIKLMYKLVDTDHYVFGINTEHLTVNVGANIDLERTVTQDPTVENKPNPSVKVKDSDIIGPDERESGSTTTRSDTVGSSKPKGDGSGGQDEWVTDIRAVDAQIRRAGVEGVSSIRAVIDGKTVDITVGQTIDGDLFGDYEYDYLIESIQELQPFKLSDVDSFNVPIRDVIIRGIKYK